MGISDDITNSVLAGFVDKEKYTGNTEFAPKLLINSTTEKVKTYIEEELATCAGFTFAVAFISEAIITDLKVKFADLAAKGIRGRIITSTYLGFNNPKVFKELLKIPNVEVRVLNQDTDFHAKGYLFDKRGYQTLILGSSNLTNGALVKNYEWNIKLNSLENADFTQQLVEQVEKQWTIAHPLTAQWIENYASHYIRQSINSSFVEELDANYTVKSVIEPNKMQKEALQAVQNLRNEGKSKALIVSATGTGKTYLGAFDVKQFAPKSFLFVVHREQILNKALESFYEVIGGSHDDYGILSGNNKDLDKKYLFATIQSISKDNILKQYDKNKFDYILIDEAHKSGAESYQRLANYFTPKFLLGMTATPERTDDFNIYELFDYNIAYEIRLQDAIEEDMLSQFHYIGVTDYEYNGEIINDNSKLKDLVSEERINYVEEQIKYYGHAGEQTSGLIFCSRKEEANEIAEIMTDRGYPSCALTGEDSINRREEVIKKFEQGQLEYIVTVDIFNEGIDIPQINQIIMLRNTQSSIVFVQQLGRGLRKFHGKDFVTIIDFIGNYKNNYLIPIALTGDKSRNKNNIRSKLITSQLIGMSAINFSEVAKKRIYESINRSNLTQIKQLRAEYLDLKERLGNVPSMRDFQKWGSIDPQVLVDKFDNYYQFLIRMNEDIYITNENEQFLNLISKEFLNGKRVHELILLQSLFRNNGSYSRTVFLAELKRYGTFTDAKTIRSVERILNLEYFGDSDTQKYGNTEYVKLIEDNYLLNKQLLDNYHNSKTFSCLIDDAIATGLVRSKQYDKTKPFTIGKKYSRKDVNRLLNWDNEQASAMYGYAVKFDTCPMFITYEKNKHLEGIINYDNKFYNTSTMKWYTRAPRKLTSPEVRKIVDGNKKGTLDIHVFIKKSDDEGTDFYCLGNADVIQDTVEQTTVPVKNINKDVVAMNLKLQQPMDYNLYLNIVGQ